MSETNYTVFCNEEQVTISTWSDYIPVCCPNNYRHTIDITKTIKGDTRYINIPIVKIQEEDIPTNGNYRFESFKYAITSCNLSYDISFKYPISILGVSTITNETHRGDMLNVIAFPSNNIIGAITSPISIGDSNINVSDSVLTYMNKGFMFSLNSNNIIENLGEVIDIDIANKQIITEYCASNNYSPLTPTYIGLKLKLIKNMHITEPNFYEIGGRKIGAKHLEANTIIKMMYSNSSLSNLNKELIMNMEYLY